MKRLFLFPLFFLFILSLIPLPINPVNAQSSPGWTLVKRYTFDHTKGINASEWEIYTIYADWQTHPWMLPPSITSNDELNVTVPNDPRITHPYCEYVMGIKSVEAYQLPMKVRFQVKLVDFDKTRGAMGAVWLCRDNMEVRNEVTLELRSTWYVDLGKPWLFYSTFAMTMSKKVEWHCTEKGNHTHYYWEPPYNQEIDVALYDGKSFYLNGPQYQSFTPVNINPYDANYHTFDLDIGYYNTTHRYVTGYIHGNPVYTWGPTLNVPSTPMNIYISISNPGWEKRLTHSAGIYVKYVEVYYWTDSFDNGNFNQGLSSWLYSNMQYGDYDNDGDYEVKPVDATKGWWLRQDVHVMQTSFKFSWRTFWYSAAPNSNFTVWLKMPKFCNLSLSLAYISGTTWNAAFRINRVAGDTIDVRKVNIPFNQWITFTYYRDGQYISYQIGSSPQINFTFPELDVMATIGEIDPVGWSQNFLLDDFQLTVGYQNLQIRWIKLTTSSNNGFTYPNVGLYYVRYGTFLTFNATPESGFYTVWNVKDITGNYLNYNVTSNILTWQAAYDAFITAIFINGTGANGYSISPATLDIREKTCGYKVEDVKGSSSPNWGTYTYTPNTQLTVTASPYNGYWFYRWIAVKYDETQANFNVGQNTVQVLLNTTANGLPFWKHFIAIFTSCKVTLNLIDSSTGASLTPTAVYVYDGGAYQTLKLLNNQIFWIKGGTWTFTFYVSGYYSKSVTVALDQMEETLTVQMQKITYSGGGEAFPCPRLIVGDTDLGFINIHASQDVIRTVDIPTSLLIKAWNGEYIILKLIEGSPEYSVSESYIDAVYLNGKPPYKALLNGVDVTNLVNNSDDSKVFMRLNDELVLYFKDIVKDSIFTIEGCNMLKMSYIYTFEFSTNATFSGRIFNLFDIQTSGPAHLTIKVHLHTYYPTIEFYGENVTSISFNMTRVFEYLGDSYYFDKFMDVSRFNGIAVNTNIPLTVKAELPSKPKNIWKTSNEETIEFKDWIWDGNAAVLTIASGDPAFSITYPSAMDIAVETSWTIIQQFIPTIIILALLLIAIRMMMHWAR